MNESWSNAPLKDGGAGMSKPKTRAEEIAYDVGVKDGQRGQDKCPYLTEPFAQCWRYGYAQATGEMKTVACANCGGTGIEESVGAE